MSAPGQERHVVVVDVETTGFDPDYHACVEVGWWDLNTGERGHFIPQHDVAEVLGRANVKALQINRYIDRIADQPQDETGTEVQRLANALDGNTLAGSNPAFDAGFLRTVFKHYEDRSLIDTAPRWHHRMWDLAPYAAGVLGMDYLPGLAAVCDQLYIEAQPDHTAEGDVTATGDCFLDLFRRAGVTLR